MPGELWIPGPLPGLNEILEAAKGAGGSGARYARLKKQWTETVAWLAVKARFVPLSAPAHFAFTWRERDRRRNPDNIAAGGRKLVFDGLVLAKKMRNDGWGEIAGWSDAFEVVQDSPGVRLVVVHRGGA